MTPLKVVVPEMEAVPATSRAVSRLRVPIPTRFNPESTKRVLVSKIHSPAKVWEAVPSTLKTSSTSKAPEIKRSLEVLMAESVAVHVPSHE